MTIKTILVDRETFDHHADVIVGSVSKADFTGIDVETQDSNRHAGLNTFCGYKADGTRAKNKKLVFDMKRTVMTGFSLYPEGADYAYYVNLNHADVENRLPWKEARQLIDAKPKGKLWIAHNAPYELTSFRNCYDLRLDDVICTMQMAVSAFGPDEYEIGKFIGAGQGGIAQLIPQLIRLAMTYEPSSRNMPPELQELVGKIIAKESDAEHSYNGFVKAISYGYGLKGLTEKFFGHKMTTFEQVLNGRAHMGQLTGAETQAYGAEDAYWAVRLFRRLLQYMAESNPAVIKTFFDQENPMIYVFSDIWDTGMKVNTGNITARRDGEREEMAKILVEMKSNVQALLPFPAEPHEGLLTDDWYKKGYAKYRKQIVDWANSPTPNDVYDICQEVRGPVSNAWATELGKPESKGPNFSHYMPQRTLMYDLLQQKVIRSQGKIQSDGEARGKLLDRLEDDRHKAIIQSMNKISGVEQVMKLYLTPYTQLMDPESGCLYPTVSSLLATRRMGMVTPNAMQLTKRGESTYVRGFYEADTDEHVLISCDWSAVELVEIGEFSADPEFIKAFGQIPHEDLHSGAAAALLSIDVPGMTEERFKSIKKFDNWDDYRDNYGQEMTNYNRLMTNLKGELLSTSDAVKYWRTSLGKTSNFGYWYSGFLGTVGEFMGWDMEKTGEATKAYRERFAVAELWRTDLIEEGKRKGFVELPDHHRRVRFEATEMWAQYFGGKFKLAPNPDDPIVVRYNAIWDHIIRKIQTRANNQLVNAVIQGSCATLAKRSIIRIIKKARDLGWDTSVFRFVMPVHDELVFSVHRSIAVEATRLIRETMIDHPDMFKHCKLDASPSIGLTFEPFSAKKGIFTGQVELFEMPDIGLGAVGQRANDNQIAGVVDYLFDQRKLAA